MVNVIFLIFYLISIFFFTGESLYYILIFQCLVCIVKSLKQKNYITPIFTFYIGVIITNLANLSLIGQVANHNIKAYNYIVPRYIDDAVKLWCVSCTLIIIGYDLFSKRSFASIAVIVTKKQNLKIIFGILVGINLLRISGGTVRLNGSGVFKIIGLLNMVGIMFFARLWSKDNIKTYRNYALTLYVLQTYVALLTAFLRSDLIIPSFCLFLGYFIGKGHIKYVFSYRILPFILIVVLYSSTFSSLQTNRSNFINAFYETSAPIEKSTENSTALLDRNANLAQLTNIVKLVKQNGFYEGKASAPLVLALIPRFIWPDKPVIAIGAWFALEIGAAYKADNGRANNSINMTLPGELYLDFGWTGLVLGSLLMGAFIAALWNATKFYESEYNITGTLFGGYLFFLSVFGFAGDLQILITLVSTYLMFYLIKKVIVRL